MPDVKVYGTDGTERGELTLEPSIFGVEVRPDLVHAAVTAHLAGRRLGTHRAKSRGEVSGGGRKPWRQKGTGRARHGSTRSPLWKGGGVVHPPLPRSYAQRLPRKVRRRAMASAWSDHVQQDTLRVVEAFDLAAPKTRLACQLLTALLGPYAQAEAAAVEPPPARPEGDERPVRRRKVRRHVLVLLEANDEVAARAFQNLAKISFDLDEKVTVTYVVDRAIAPYATTYDLTWADVVVASRGAIERVTAEFAPTEEVEA